MNLTDYISDFLRRKAAQEGWFWSGRGEQVHFPGPSEGWSLCGTAKLKRPANKPFLTQCGLMTRIGRRCPACVRLYDA